MQKSQISVILISSALTFGLYFGGRFQPSHKEGPAKSENAPVKLNEQDVVAKAKQALDSSKMTIITALEANVSGARDIETEKKGWIELSKTWNDWKNFTVGGICAEKVAALSPNTEAWKIAASTYSIAYSKEQDQALKRFDVQKSIAMFEKAIASDTTDLELKIGKALMTVELSSVDPSVLPMQGILQLREIADKNPASLKAQASMSRFHLKRGQADKAAERLEKVLAATSGRSKDRAEAFFMLGQAYGELHNIEGAKKAYSQAIEASDDKGFIELAKKQISELK